MERRIYPKCCLSILFTPSRKRRREGLRNKKTKKGVVMDIELENKLYWWWFTGVYPI